MSESYSELLAKHKLPELSAKQIALRNCIFRGSAILIGILSLLVCVCIYTPWLSNITASDTFRNIAIALSLVSLIMTIIHSFNTFSRSLTRAWYVSFAVSTAMLLVFGAHHTKDRQTVFLALLTTAILIASASFFGGNTSTDLTHWAQPLSLCISVLILAWCVNVFLLQSDTFQTTLSLGTAAALTFATIFHTQIFIRHTDFCTPHCCEDGVFHTFANFIAISRHLMDSMDSLS